MVGGIAALLGLPTDALFLFIALTTARPIGLFFGFLAFAWGMGQGFILRVGLAMAFGLPVSIAMRDDIADLATTASVMDLVLLMPKEFALGYGLGILASLPLLALQFAGALTDSFRGESGSGHPDPTGGTLGTWSTWLLVIGFLVFAGSGGFQGLVAALYASYTVWPMTQMLAPLTPAAVGVFLDLLGQTLRQTIIVAAPMLITLLAVDLSLAIGSRLAQRFQIMSLEFAVKNLVAVLLMPAMALFVLRYLGETPVAFDEVVGALRQALP
jgi:type III secretion protein T